MPEEITQDQMNFLMFLDNQLQNLDSDISEIMLNRTVISEDELQDALIGEMYDYDLLDL